MTLLTALCCLLALGGCACHGGKHQPPVEVSCIPPGAPLRAEFPPAEPLPAPALPTSPIEAPESPSEAEECVGGQCEVPLAYEAPGPPWAAPIVEPAIWAGGESEILEIREINSCPTGDSNWDGALLVFVVVSSLLALLAVALLLGWIIQWWRERRNG